MRVTRSQFVTVRGSTMPSERPGIPCHRRRRKYVENRVIARDDEREIDELGERKKENR